ncbi:hypothetical protein DL96DRAFT_1822246 [Flagelloscypha sp. PMI_526]|nr:hypothetical protein DL96DRAFT_1822246 [Flagelloscypha sp. PMI_526]
MVFQRCGEGHWFKYAPVEIQLEVFSLVEPLDLLALSRLSRAFRKLLVNRDWLWARARKGIRGIPRKPDDISEPRFARLIFDTMCMGCHSEKGLSFSYGSRWCKECMTSEILQPWQAFKLGNGEHTFASAGFTKAQVEAILPGYTSDLGTGTRLHIRFEALQVLDRLISSGALEDGDMKEWFQIQLEVKKEKEKFVVQCNSWELQAGNHKRIGEDIEILKRLSRLGWDDTLKEFTKNSELHSVFHSIIGFGSRTRVKDHAWTVIQPKIVAFLEGVRARRLAIQTKVRRTRRLDALARSRKTYRKTMSLDTILPPLIDLALFLPFLEVIESEDEMDTFEVETAFEHLFHDHFRKVSDEWLRTIHAQLLHKGNDAEQYQPSVLHLASTTITCQTCKRSNMLYPQVLYHSCGVEKYQEPRYHPSKPTSAVLSPEDGIRDCLRNIWPNHRRSLVLNLNANSRASSLIELCGLDPLTTTYQGLMVRNPLFECTKCTKKATKFVMNFPSAINVSLILLHIAYIPFIRRTRNVISEDNGLVVQVQTTFAS